MRIQWLPSLWDLEPDGLYRLVPIDSDLISFLFPSIESAHLKVSKDYALTPALSTPQREADGASTRLYGVSVLAKLQWQPRPEQQVQLLRKAPIL